MIHFQQGSNEISFVMTGDCKFVFGVTTMKVYDTVFLG